MTVHVAWLRAINLGSRRRFGMPDLVACLEAEGFTDVATHLATGNVRATSRMRSSDRVAERMAACFAADRGFEVPVAVVTPAELTRVAEQASAFGEGAAQAFVTFLVGDPDPDGVREVEAWDRGGTRAQVRGRTVQWAVEGGYKDATLDNGLLERRLGTPGTTRNLRVVTTLAERWGT